MPARCCRSPDRPAPGLTTYEAKDPETAYPPIEPLLPPEGAPNVLIPPDLAAMDFLYQLGEIAAAGDDIRSRLFS
jgi:hypothetical protein